MKKTLPASGAGFRPARQEGHWRDAGHQISVPTITHLVRSGASLPCNDRRSGRRPRAIIWRRRGVRTSAPPVGRSITQQCAQSEVQPMLPHVDGPFTQTQEP